MTDKTVARKQTGEKSQANDDESLNQDSEHK